MKISTFSDYCLRVLIFLSVYEGRRASAREIAEHYDVSSHHIAKVSKWLTKEGYLIAAKGKGGGLLLAVPCEQISIGSIIRRTEEGVGMVECMRGDRKCRIQGVCGLEGILRRAEEKFLSVLDGYSLADATVNQMGIRRMLEMAAD